MQRQPSSRSRASRDGSILTYSFVRKNKPAIQAAEFSKRTNRFTLQYIKALLLTTPHAGSEVFIPRFDSTPGDEKKRGYTFTRRQFPVRLCFAMTINKAQGQTLDKVLIKISLKMLVKRGSWFYSKSFQTGFIPYRWKRLS